MMYVYNIIYNVYNNVSVVGRETWQTEPETNGKYEKFKSLFYKNYVVWFSRHLRVATRVTVTYDDSVIMN